jgi:hypothetical protein
MSTDANAIVFGQRTMEELAAALRASGLVNDVAVLHGDGEILGKLIFTARAHPGMRVMWAFPSASADHTDVYAGERTILHIGIHNDGAALLEAAVRPFGGYQMDDERTGEWRPVASVATEFAPLDRLHIDIARMIGPTRAELLMPVITDEQRREDLIRAIREAYPEPAPAPGI